MLALQGFTCLENYKYQSVLSTAVNDALPFHGIYHEK